MEPSNPIPGGAPRLSGAELFAAAHGSAHSWDEDFRGENGNYQNKCIECGTLFLGHKRRLVCKVCDTKAREKWNTMTEDERQESIARTRDAMATFYALNGAMSSGGKAASNCSVVRPVTSHPQKWVECDDCGRVEQMTAFLPLKLSSCKQCGSTRLRIYKPKTKPPNDALTDGRQA